MFRVTKVSILDKPVEDLDHVAYRIAQSTVDAVVLSGESIGVRDPREDFIIDTANMYLEALDSYITIIEVERVSKD